jgi:hypothetical protein
MVGDVPLQVHDGDGFVELTTSAFHLTGMSAHPATNTWERIRSLQNFVGIVNAPSSNQGNIGRNVHPHRASVLTGTLKKGRANRSRATFITDVGFVFMAEVANGAQYWIG